MRKHFTDTLSQLSLNFPTVFQGFCTEIINSFWWLITLLMRFKCQWNIPQVGCCWLCIWLFVLTHAFFFFFFFASLLRLRSWFRTRCPSQSSLSVLLLFVTNIKLLYTVDCHLFQHDYTHCHWSEHEMKDDVDARNQIILFTFTSCQISWFVHVTQCGSCVRKSACMRFAFLDVMMYWQSWRV